MSVVEPASDPSVMPAGRWSVDAPRSNVAFSVRHTMLARMNQILDSGGALLGNKVTITLEISAVKDKHTTFEIREPDGEAPL